MIIEANAHEAGGRARAATPWCRVPLAALCVAAVDWVARSTSFAGLDDVAKPATIATLAAWLVLALRRGPARLAGGPLGWKPSWLVAALGASLAGDVLLIKPSTAAGGAAFLVAHVCFVAALDRSWLVRLRPWLIAAVVVVGLAVPIVVLLAGTGGLLVVGIPVYAGALAVMVASALSMRRQGGVNRGAATTVAIGALMFATSDLMLFIDAAAGSERLALPAIVAYHLAQLAIVAGMVNLGLRSSRLQLDVRPVPFERSATGARRRALVAAAVATAGLGVLVVTAGHVAGPAAGGGTRSLERIAGSRSSSAVTTIVAELRSRPGALSATRRALVVDIAVPFAYGALLVLVSLAIARRLARDASPLDGLARIAGWVFIGTFCFDHLENLFLWQEISGGTHGWQVWAAFALHGLKWVSVAVGLTLLAAAATNIGVVAVVDRRRWRRSATVEVGLAGID